MVVGRAARRATATARSRRGAAVAIAAVNGPPLGGGVRRPRCPGRADPSARPTASGPAGSGRTTRPTPRMWSRSGSDLLADLADIAPRDATGAVLLDRRPGERSTPRGLDAGYWFRQPAAARPVREAVTRACSRDGARHLRRGQRASGPHRGDAGDLRGGGHRGASRSRHPAPRRRRPARSCLAAEERARLGARWPRCSRPARPTRRPARPTPSSAQRYWLATGHGTRDVAAAGLSATDHPLLRRDGRTRRAGGGLVFTGRLSLDAHPWLADHAVHGTVLLPGTAFVELAARGGPERGCGTIEELTLEAPLVLPDRGAVQLQLVVERPTSAAQRTVSSTPGPTAEPTRATGPGPGTRAGTLKRPSRRTRPPATRRAWPPPGARAVPLDDAYARLARPGYGYGPAFQGLRAAWQAGRKRLRGSRPGHRRTGRRGPLLPASRAVRRGPAPRCAGPARRA